MANNQKDVPTQYGLLLFPGFEVLDAAGPIELLNVLSFYFDHQDINLSVIAQSMDPVTPGAVPPDTKSVQFTGQQLYKPTHTFETAPALDVLIVPGGRGTAQSDEELKSTIDFVRNTYHGSDGKPPLKYAFSICTGSDLFARAGILDGKKATTNKWGWDRMTPNGPKTHWIAKARWVESGNVWTTSGVSAGIDGMAALLDKIYGDDMGTTLSNFIEHERTKDADNDPFAEMRGCKDVHPVSS